LIATTCSKNRGPYKYFGLLHLYSISSYIRKILLFFRQNFCLVNIHHIHLSAKEPKYICTYNDFASGGQKLLFMILYRNMVERTFDIPIWHEIISNIMMFIFSGDRRTFPSFGPGDLDEWPVLRCHGSRIWWIPWWAIYPGQCPTITPYRSPCSRILGRTSWRTRTGRLSSKMWVKLLN